ncbi:MAG: response regulator [Nitrospira sp.]|nr:response regulator [Nitrospira sp.]
MLKVFIADDSSIILDRLVSSISDIEGIEIVGSAQNGYDATVLISRSRPDVAILDIRMPGINGIDLLQYIKKYNLSRTVIMLTNYPFPQYQKKCMAEGADYFFDKSTEFDKAISVLKQMNMETSDILMNCEP